MSEPVAWMYSTTINAPGGDDMPVVKLELFRNSTYNLTARFDGDRVWVETPLYAHPVEACPK